MAFPLVDDPRTSLLAWTTTPWTLPSNLALCVHPDFTYIKIHDQEKDQNFILHEGLLGTLYKDPKKAKFKKLGQFQGADMKGWRYVPLFEYFTDQVCFYSFFFVNPIKFHFSSRTKPSESLSIRMLRTRMVLVLSTRPLPLERMITASLLPAEFCAKTRRLRVPSMMRVASLARFPTSRA